MVCRREARDVGCRRRQRLCESTCIYRSVGTYYTQAKAAMKIRKVITKCHTSLLNYCRSPHPRVSTTMRRNSYAVDSSEYFWHFLVAAISATSPRPRAAAATSDCCGADDCHIPIKSFPGIWVTQSGSLPSLWPAVTIGDVPVNSGTGRYSDMLAHRHHWEPTVRI